MQQAEAILGKSLTDGLVELVTLQGLSGAARHLGVSVAVIRYWLKIHNMTTVYIALGPNDSLQIIRGESEVEEKVLEISGV